MRHSNKSSKRGTSSSSTSRRSGSGRSTTGSSSRTSSDRAERSERPERSERDESDRYGALGARMSSGDYGREGMRTISGRYSDFEDYGGSSRGGQYNNDSERGFARGGRRGEYSSVNDQDFYEGNAGRSPWRDTYDSERSNSSRGSSRSQNYSGQGRSYSEYDYDDDRMSSRNPREFNRRGYGEEHDYDREGRYGSYRDRNERWMNNYDNQDEGVDDEYGFRERYNENRY